MGIWRCWIQEVGMWRCMRRIWRCRRVSACAGGKKDVDEVKLWVSGCEGGKSQLSRDNWRCRR